MSTSFKELLDHPDKKFGEAKGPLTGLWRKILGDLKIDYMKFERLFIAWHTDPSNEASKDALATERGNLMKTFEGDDITWKVFFKGMKFLRPRAMTIRVTLEWNDPRYPDGGTTVHELKVPVKDVNKFTNN